MRNALLQVAVVASALTAGAFVGISCGDEGEDTSSSTSPGSGGSGAGTGTGTATGTGTGTGTGQGGNGQGGDGTGGPGNAEEVTIAFWGDSGLGSDFQGNIQTALAEGAEAIFHAGDFDYGEEYVNFWDEVDQEVGHAFPYFLSVGNHDDGAWAGYAAHMDEHLAANNITIDDPDHDDQMWSATFKGIKLVAVGIGGSNKPQFADFITQELDPNYDGWQICNWHQNQAEMQIGGKGNEMGWDVYENCRTNGALIITGHEHSYERTKTLTSMENLTVDPTCNDPNQLCVGPGRTFTVVNGLGGVGIRDQERCLPTTYPYGCDEWAFIYAEQQSADYGALIITFNAGGDPKKATAYFKTIGGDVVDTFEITRD